MTSDKTALLRTKLKSGEYDSVDVMDACLALDNLISAPAEIGRLRRSEAEERSRRVAAEELAETAMFERNTARRQLAEVEERLDKAEYELNLYVAEMSAAKDAGWYSASALFDAHTKLEVKHSDLQVEYDSGLINIERRLAAEKTFSSLYFDLVNDLTAKLAAAEAELVKTKEQLNTHAAEMRMYDKVLEELNLRNKECHQLSAQVQALDTRLSAIETQEPAAHRYLVQGTTGNSRVWVFEKPRAGVIFETQALFTNKVKK